MARRGTPSLLWSNAVLLRASAVGGITRSVPISSCPGSRANPGTPGSFVRLPETVSTYCVNIFCRNISLLLRLCRERSAQHWDKQSESEEQSYIQHVRLPVRDVDTLRS
jgi:hypothetical protein